MYHWFFPDTPVRVSSFGGLQHFRKSEKPAAAADATRCLDCAYEPQCPYSAKKSEFSHCPVRSTASCVVQLSLVYLDRVAKGHIHWPVSPLVEGIPDIENVTEALTRGPYGKCVYESDNDVCDNQVCTMTGLRRDRTRLPLTDDARHTEGGQHPICIRGNCLIHDGRLHDVGL